MSQKPDAIRREMRARRANLSLTQVRSASERLLARLAQLPQLQQAEVIALYQPVRGEIDPRGLMLLWPEKTWVFPKVVSVENKTMHFYAPAGMEEMQTGAFGIAEPVASGRPWDDRVDAVVAPLVAYDDHGNRLGMGGGYYDRFFHRCPNAFRVGAAYAFQRHPGWPVQPWDIPLDCVATDEAVLPVATNRG